MTLTEEQRLEFKPIAEAFDEEWTQQVNARKASYSQDVINFIDANRYSYYYRDSFGAFQDAKNTKIGKKLYQHLSEEKAPSEFFKVEMPKHFPGWIYEGHLAAFYYAVDHVKEWQIDSSAYRRAVRSKKYVQCFDKIMSIMREFHKASVFQTDILNIYRGNLRSGLKEKWLLEPDSYDMKIPSSLIAGELGIGNEKLEDILIDVLNNDAENNHITYDLIRGIMMSHNKRLYEHLGKVLIAARLQEGLRQSICESMDAGCVEAFQYFLQIVIDQNLIRFSSVKRAAGTWTGLLGDEEAVSDRIDEKRLRLIGRFLKDENAREQALVSKDAMEVYLSLWSSGFYDLNVVLGQVQKMVQYGEALQAKVACVYMHAIPWNDFRHQVGKVILTKYADDLSVIAGVMNHFMINVSYDIRSSLHYEEKRPGHRVLVERDVVDYKTYFDSLEECRTFYDLLWQIYDNLPKRKVEFQPYIFPWDKVTLTTADLLDRIAFCANALKDEEAIERVAVELPKFDIGNYGSRESLMTFLLAFPKTEKQKELLVEEIADKETYTRETAMMLVKNISLEKKHYLQLEKMLRYKRDDIRSNVLSLLYGMEDDLLCDSIERLLLDKKEEKRTGGLDLLLQLKRDEERQEAFDKALPLLDVMPEHTGKEDILIKEIQKSKDSVSDLDNQSAWLYDSEADYEPVFDEDFLNACQDTFVKWFPNTKYTTLKPSRLKGIFSRKRESLEGQVLKKMDKLADALKHEEYVDEEGETTLFGADNRYSLYRMKVPPKKELLDEFYEKEISSDGMLLRLQFLLDTSRESAKEEAAWGTLIPDLFGVSSKEQVNLVHENQIRAIIKYYEKFHEDKAGRRACAVYVERVLLEQPGDLFEEVEVRDYQGVLTGYQMAAISTLPKMKMLLSYIVYHCEREFKQKVFPIHYAFAKKQHFAYYRKKNENGEYGGYITERMCYHSNLNYPGLTDYLHAYHRGVISKDYLYKTIFEVLNTAQCLRDLSSYYIYQMEREFVSSGHGISAYWEIRTRENAVEELLGHKLSDGISEEDEKLLGRIPELYRELTDPMVEAELLRGDSPTPYTGLIYNVLRIYGADKFIHILTALGKETLERSSYFNSGYSYHQKISKKQGLSHLLQVCMPTPEDNKEKLKALFEQSDVSEKRLVEASLYSPEWIKLVAEALGWEGYEAGCYYFMAHMKEDFDDRRAAKIARYTPLTVEELNDGAVDVDWFREVYEKLGEKHFEAIYQAAKYISDGAKHTRARKYADAILGKLGESEVKEQIAAKRNKDLVMAYSLLPIEDEKQVLDRYLFLQQFLKESKQFGAQRRASEKLAVENSLINLAYNAGYQDITRLTLRMESNVVESMMSMFQPKEVGEIKVWLTVDEEGTCNVVCEKAGKIMKSIPAKYKKDDYVKQLTESKNQLKQQRIRTKKMLEDAMEHQTDFLYEECQALLKNPVTRSLMARLAVCVDGQYGFISEHGFEKMNVASCTLAEAVLLDAKKLVQIVHTYHLYKDSQLHAFQQYLFDQKMKQPFKQVFRELYVKTEEEMEMKHSLRYAGNQIQTGKTLGCLRGRQWVADEESGLQKVYYKENIVAELYALANWFSPSDIEAPTLEWVVFTNRKTGKELKIGEIPDVIFSEVMRDVDMAVSVAHAGGVDPETSHSTMEMRRAIAEFTLPLFKLTNVTFSEHHALIKGTRGEYSVHLGSGVVHQIGGSMIAVLPVHSGQRGKVFLPFVDEDPKTAEVITKILFFAEDKKIKDPSILRQIK